MLTAFELKELLKSNKLRLTKRFGQNYLINPRVIERIISGCELLGDETVLEIGAGLGALTEPLSKRARHVIALEIDIGIAGLLRKHLSSLNNVTVVCQDILDIRLKNANGITVVGAIPYYVTSPILVSLSEASRAIRKSILVLQHEVAKRLIALPGTKAYGRLSVLGQYYWDIEVLFSVSRSAFFPQPGVDSLCLRFLPRSKAPVDVCDEQMFFGLVKAAFAHRRKSLANCLSDYGSHRTDVSQIKDILRALDLPSSVRGEALSLEQFAQLSSAFARLKSS